VPGGPSCGLDRGPRAGQRHLGAVPKTGCRGLCPPRSGPRARVPGRDSTGPSALSRSKTVHRRVSFDGGPPRRRAVSTLPLEGGSDGLLPWPEDTYSGPDTVRRRSVDGPRETDPFKDPFKDPDTGLIRTGLGDGPQDAPCTAPCTAALSVVSSTGPKLPVAGGRFGAPLNCPVVASKLKHGTAASWTDGSLELTTERFVKSTRAKVRSKSVQGPFKVRRRSTKASAGSAPRVPSRPRGGLHLDNTLLDATPECSPPGRRSANFLAKRFGFLDNAIWGPAAEKRPVGSDPRAQRAQHKGPFETSRRRSL